MKKAVIATGGKQYLVAEGEEVTVELLKESDGKSLDFQPLLVIDGDKVDVGTPAVAGARVVASVVQKDVRAEKVTSIRFKAKKRVHKVRGHRQHLTTLKINSIS